MSSLKKVSSIISTILIAIIVLIAVLLAGTKVFGLAPYTVLSGSMEPTYHTGSLIYVKKATPENISIGDPITFYMSDNKTVATHRVVRIDSENKAFYTKGDANAAEDAQPVNYSHLIGTPEFTIPYFGYISAFLTTAAGKTAMAALVVLALAFTFAPDILSEKTTKKEEQE